MGLTAAQLGARLGVRETTVLRWETGASSPTPRHLAAIARIVDLEPADLVPGLARRRPTLRDLRLLAALDITTTSELTKLSRSAIVRLERGITPVRDRSTALATAYGVDVAAIEEAAARTRALLGSQPPSAVTP